MAATSRRTTDLGVRVDRNDPLLAVEDLRVEFRLPGRVVHAVNGLSYTLDERQTVGILGESGSGKSVGANAVMRILDTPPGFVTGGHVRYRGVDLLEITERQMRSVRGQRIAMIFQDALASLNPVVTVGFQIAEMFRVHRGVSRSEGYNRAVELMDRVRIPSARDRLGDYPFQFSGGMRQRVMIAVALALDPDVLIADEPTTALDVTVQAQIMQLLADLQDQTGMGLVLITHDLGVVAEVCDRVNVMYAGRVVERAPIHALYANPAHPYTRGLLRSIPRADTKAQRLEPITGTPPDLSAIPSGCEFHPRCPLARDRCTMEQPPLYDLGLPGQRHSACHYWREVLDAM